jgi:predicted GIY-YIG superfamily endonuclease
MPATDEDFITRRIYAIKCDLDNMVYYVGSTKNSLNRRFGRHKTGFNFYMNGNKR